MSDENPYTAPDAALATGADELYEPSVISFSGRIGRLRYLAYGMGAYLIMILVMGIVGALVGPAIAESMITLVILVPIIVLYFVFTIMVGKRRLNDLDRSGWWLLLLFVPIVNFLLAIYMLFFPGTDGSNTYGSAAVANSLGVKILVWLIPVVAIIGVIAAVAIPQYMAFAGGGQ